MDSEMIMRMAEEGLTKAQIAYILGMPAGEFKPGKELTAAINAGKAAYKNKIAESLYKCATGYTYTETRYCKKGDGWIKRKIKKHVPPNAFALTFLYVREIK